jgi:hypothetical protein
MKTQTSSAIRLALWLVLILPLPAQAKFVTTDANGNEVELKFADSPFRQFQRTYSFDTFQLLDATDRDYALPEALIASLDPNSKLTATQQTGLRHVLSQHYDTLPEAAREAIERKVFWMAFLGGQPALAQKVAAKFLSPYPDQRGKQLCTLVRDSTQMVLYKGETPTIHYLMKLGAEQMGLLATLIDSNKEVGNEKCPLGDDDKQPLSLKEMRAEIIKAGLAPLAKENPSGNATAQVRTPCRLAEIKSIFQDAITSIETNGPKTKVYLGMHRMTCPIYGLVVRDPRASFRYFPDSYREDVVPGLRFKSADDIIAMFQVVPSSQTPSATSPSGNKATKR